MTLENPLDWDVEPKQNKAELDKAKAERYRLDIEYLKTFTTPQGKTVLEHLRKNTLEAATWMSSIANRCGIDASNAHGYAREGQNALVRDIENRMERARTYQQENKV